MKDRIPVNPGRVLITPEDGSAAFYATMTRADNPTQVGTPLNKASLLTDATALLLGLTSEDPTVNDALTALCNRKHLAFGTYDGTGTFGADNQNTLSFDFVPKALFICADVPYSNAGWLVCDVGGFYDETSSGDLISSVDGNTVSWYNDSSAQRQLNLTDRTYHYVAIGEIGA